MTETEFSKEQYIKNEYEARGTGTGHLWLKWRTALLDEPKYMQLSDMAKAVYLEVYMLAGKSDAGGLVLTGNNPAGIAEIAWTLRRSESDLNNSLDDLERAGFIDLKDDQVTVCRFAGEQGPSIAKKRQEWAYRQAKRRALANGQEWQDSEPETDSEKEKERDKEKEKDKDLKTKTKTKTQTKTKSVTRPSPESHERVTRDIDSNEGKSVFDDLSEGTLALWDEIKGTKYKPTATFQEMIKYWESEGVQLTHIQRAIEQVKDTAGTPLYLREVALTMRNNDGAYLAQKQQNKFRDSYKQEKQNGT